MGPMGSQASPIPMHIFTLDWSFDNALTVGFRLVVDRQARRAMNLYNGSRFHFAVDILH